jgi:hypothetical protein
MLHFLMSHWQIATLLAVVFGGGGWSNPAEVDEDLEWAAHPMNKVSVNYDGD